MPINRKFNWLIAGGIALLGLAALLRWWAAPVFERLPSDYTSDTFYDATTRSHQTPTAPADEVESVVRRHDQAQASSNEQAIIQGEMHWLTQAGTVIFETLNLYGVDRNSRQNMAGYGSHDRIGLYLFPPHVEKTQYGLWDPVYAGPGVAIFDRVNQFQGLEVYVFNFRADGIDETEGYASRPDVPKKYRALTHGQGRLWIEPVSGIVVDHEDSGVSYFIDASTGQRVGEPINEWRARYTPQTRQAQLQRAIRTRRWTLALELGLPLALTALGLTMMALAFGRPHRARA